MKLHTRTLLGEVQLMIVLVSMAIIIPLAGVSLFIVSYTMLTDLQARSVATADEIQSLLEHPLYVVDDEHAVRIGKTFLSSEKISGIVLESTSNGLLLSNTTGKDSPRIPRISRDITHNGLLLGKFTIIFSDEKIINTLSSFGTITFFIILAVLFANITANRYLITPRVRRPFSTIFSALKKLAEGNYETQIDPTPYQDLNDLILRFNDMASKINHKNLELQENEFRFRAFFDLAPFSCVVTDQQARYRMVNRTFCHEFSLSEQQVVGHTENEIGILIENAHSGAIISKRLDVDEINNEEAIIRLAQGNRHVLYSSRLIEFGGEQLILSATVDITERKEAENEKEQLQNQLMQAQKMESVGRLAGGVAHDFNNMLTVILGLSQLAKMKCKPTDAIHSDLKTIEETSLRSADLVRQLLTFARKQTIDPEIIDLNRSILNMFKMLERLIGEHLDLIWKQEENLWSVKIDATQVDQIVANLCVNARDAIADVGKISIETANIILDENYSKVNPDSTPGEYVMLAVSDNGCGIEKHVMSHIFEPFFTTKEKGKGSGMGLATVYGIAQQNKGFIDVYSEPDKGTTFKVFLPRFTGEAKKATATKTATPITANGETVLLVEDEVVILEVTKTMLEQLGYTVLTAGKPSEALIKAQEHIDQLCLLVTDVVMPEMNGIELEKNIRKLKPELKCLFISGYTDATIVHHGVLDEGVCFLQKPFSLHDLGTKVKEALKS